jgi:hypothetical protein
MKLRDQVCSKQQSEKLMSLGVAQKGLWRWAMDEIELTYSGNEGLLSAFTVAELGVMLPDFSDQWDVYKTSVGWTYRVSEKGASSKTLTSGIVETEAQARATILIFFLESNVATPSEVNARLTAQ